MACIDYLPATCRLVSFGGEAARLARRPMSIVSADVALIGRAGKMPTKSMVQTWLPLSVELALGSNTAGGVAFCARFGPGPPQHMTHTKFRGRCFRCLLLCRGRSWRSKCSYPRKVRNTCSPHFPEGYPRRTRRPSEFSKRCPAVVEQLLRESRFGPNSASIGRNLVTGWPNFATCWPVSTTLGRQILTEIGQGWSRLAKLRPQLAQSWPHSGQTRPAPASIG